MKKTLLMILSFILLSTVTACGARDVIYECNCTCNCEHTSSETEVAVLIESTQGTSSSESTTNAVVENEITEVTKFTEVDDEAKKSLYYEAKNLYLTGEWDGKPTIMDGQNVSLSEHNGCLLVNGYIVSNFQRSLDLPDPFTDSVSSYVRYIPGQGMYAIKDKTLIKYVRGELISLGDSIDWIGFDPQYPEEYDCTIVDGYKLYLPDSKGSDDYTYVLWYEPYLYYDNESDELLLVTTDIVSNLQHMYLFPDYNISETIYLGPILDFFVFGNQSNDTFYYLDTDKIAWEYTENGPKQLDESEALDLFADYF